MTSYQFHNRSGITHTLATSLFSHKYFMCNRCRNRLRVSCRANRSILFLKLKAYLTIQAEPNHWHIEKVLQIVINKLAQLWHTAAAVKISDQVMWHTLMPQILLSVVKATSSSFFLHWIIINLLIPASASCSQYNVNDNILHVWCNKNTVACRGGAEGAPAPGIQPGGGVQKAITIIVFVQMSKKKVIIIFCMFSEINLV